MIQEFNHIEKVNGELNLPGDKSISHRALIFSAMADGVSEITNLSDGVDVNSTIDCLVSLGTKFERLGNSVKVGGKGNKKFSTPLTKLNAGNSGTTARLLSGLLAAQSFESEIIGDESLSKRPMRRVIEPLKIMGANIKLERDDKLPIKILPVEELNSIDYQLPIASAQVKSAILIASLHCKNGSVITDPFGTRDHTERMLQLKTDVNAKSKIIYASKSDYPHPNSYFIPSDISTASFFMVLTLLSHRSELRIQNLGINPTRSGVLKIFTEMGANIFLENENVINNEPTADVIVKSSSINNIEIKAEIIPNIIDEIPILSIAGLFADGKFEIRNAKELRKKESDRIKSLCYNYKLLGLDVDEFEDGFSVSGQIRNHNPIFESFGDHRIAMAFSILSIVLKEGGKVNNFECAGISNPNFINQLKQITA